MLFYGLVGLAFLLCFNTFNHISEYLFFVLVALGVLKIFHAKSISYIPTSIDLPLLIFLGWILVTLPFALDPVYSFVEWRKALPRFCIFWLVLQVVRNPSQVKAVLHGFVMGLGILCAVEVIEFFAIGGKAFSMDVRAGSFFGAHQWLSNYLVIGGPFLWLSWVSQEYAWEKVMNGMVFAIYPVALFLVHTRSAWLVVLVQLSVFGLYRITGKFLLSVGIILLGVLVMGISLNQSGEFRNALSRSDFSSAATLELRFNTWNVAMEDIQNSPIVGVGFGKHTYQIFHPSLSQQEHSHIHNMFLGAAFQLGVPGLLVLLFLFWKILSASASWIGDVWKHDSFNSQLGMAIGLMTIGVMVRNCFDDMFHGAIVYLFMLFVAMGFCLHHNWRKDWSWSSN